VFSSQPETGQAAVLFSPLLNADQSLERAARADALILRDGGWRNVVIVAAPDAAGRDRLRGAGAWLVIDAGSALGCVIAARSNDTSSPPKASL